MQLESDTGAIVAFSIVGYQFPGAPSGDDRFAWDANWLAIQGTVVTSDGARWTFTDPCLLTTEARELGAWLQSAAQGAETPVAEDLLPTAELVTFTEPVVALSLASFASDRVEVRIHLSLEAAPPPSSDGTRSGLFEHFVPIGMAPSNLAAVAAE